MCKISWILSYALISIGKKWHLNTVICTIYVVGPISSIVAQADPQTLLSKVIDDTFRGNNPASMPGFKNGSINYLQSSVSHLQHVCGKSAHAGEDRIGCCSPTDTRHLFNVMIDHGKFIMFTGNKSSSLTSKDSKHHTLTNIKSVKMRRQHDFKMNLEERSESFPSSKCKNTFHGTLHVIGRGTTHNVYHAGI
jgi:hypothetical protein